MYASKRWKRGLFVPKVKTSASLRSPRASALRSVSKNTILVDPDDATDAFVARVAPLAPTSGPPHPVVAKDARSNDHVALPET